MPRETGSRQTSTGMLAERPAQELSYRLRCGERAAFDELVRGLWEPVMRFFWTRTSNDEAREMSRHAFLRAFRTFEERDVQAIGNVSGWRRFLLSVARECWNDHCQRAGGRTIPRAVDELLEGAAHYAVRRRSRRAGPPAASVSPQEIAAVRDCLGALRVEWRCVCWLYYVDRIEKREIARSLGQSEAAVRTRIVQSLAQLRLCLRAKRALS